MNVFISYKRNDSNIIANRLYDELTRRMSNDFIFKDQEVIDTKEPFAEVIGKSLREADLVLALIGNTWGQSITDTNINDLFADENDWVRKELSTALTLYIPVIPILIDDTPFPEKDRLPTSMEKLCDRDALKLRASIPRDWNLDISHLITEVEKHRRVVHSIKPLLKSTTISITALILLIAIIFLFPSKKITPPGSLVSNGDSMLTVPKITKPPKDTNDIKDMHGPSTTQIPSLEGIKVIHNQAPLDTLGIEFNFSKYLFTNHLGDCEATLDITFLYKENTADVINFKCDSPTVRSVTDGDYRYNISITELTNYLNEVSLIIDLTPIKG